MVYLAVGPNWKISGFAFFLLEMSFLMSLETGVRGAIKLGLLGWSNMCIDFFSFFLVLESLGSSSALQGHQQ